MSPRSYSPRIDNFLNTVILIPSFDNNNPLLADIFFRVVGVVWLDEECGIFRECATLTCSVCDNHSCSFFERRYNNTNKK